MNPIVALNSAGTIIKGIKLIKKPYKTEFEEKAARSFVSYMKATIIGTLVFVAIIITGTILTVDNTTSHTIEKYGNVKGQNVSYYQDGNKLVPLEKLGIDASSVQEGTSVMVYLNSDYDVVGGRLNDGSIESKSLLAFIGLVGFSIFYLVGLIVFIIKKAGRDWIEWLKYN